MRALQGKIKRWSTDCKAVLEHLNVDFDDFGSEESGFGGDRIYS